MTSESQKENVPLDRVEDDELDLVDTVEIRENGLSDIDLDQMEPDVVDDENEEEDEEEEDEDFEDDDDDNVPIGMTMSPKQFADEVIEKMFHLREMSHLIKLLDETTSCLDNLEILLFDFEHVFGLCCQLINKAILDPFFIPLTDSLNCFLRQICASCYHFGIQHDGISRQSTKLNLNHKKSAWKLWIRIVRRCLRQFLQSLSLVSYGKCQNNNPIILSTVPLALQSFLVIGITFCPNSSIKKLGYVFRNFCKIVKLYTEANDGLKDPFGCWNEFVYNLNYYITIYSAINIANQFEESDLCCFILYIIRMGLDNLHFNPIESNGKFCSKSKKQSSFVRHLTPKAIKDLASTLVISPSDLFLFFQKDISDLLIEYCCGGSNDSNDSNSPFSVFTLYECMDFFGIGSLPSELLRWIIPPFVVKRNQETRKLLDEIQKVKRKPPIFAIKLYLIDILIYIFYDCHGDATLIYQVFQYLSDYCQQNVFGFLFGIFGRFTESFLQRFSLDRVATLRGLSYICNLDTLIVDPEKLDSICDVDLERFTSNEKHFVNFLHHHFPVFIHKFDTTISRVSSTINEKIVILQSLEQLMKYLSNSFINRYRMKIYFTIRFLLSEHYYSMKSLLKISLNILTYFIHHVEGRFLKSELASICLLILPLVKILPEDATKVFHQLLIVRKFSSDIYHKLYFVPKLSALQPINEQIWNRTEDLREIISRFPSFESINFSDENRVIRDILKSESFGAKCLEIRFVQEHINHCNENLQQVALRRLYELLDQNKELFYRLCSNTVLSYDTLHSTELSLSITGLLANNQSQSDQQSSQQLTAFNCESSGSGSIKSGKKSKKEDLKSATSSTSITLSQFFRELIQCLLECLQFSSGEIRLLTLNCLGVLGAIDPIVAQLNRPFCIDSYEKNHSRKKISLPAVLDHSQRDIFLPKRKSFKLIILELLMNQVRSSNQIHEFNTATFSIQELLHQFTSVRKNTLLSDFEASQAAIVSSGTLSGQIATSNRLRSTIGRYVEDQIQRKLLNENERLKKVDEIERLMIGQQYDSLVENVDLTGELRDYCQLLNASLYSTKRINQMDCTMDGFFRSIQPSMSYRDFLDQFIRMLYQCFIVPDIVRRQDKRKNAKSNKSSNESSTTTTLSSSRTTTTGTTTTTTDDLCDDTSNTSSTSPALNEYESSQFYRELFSQSITSSQSQRNSASFKQELELILSKLDSIQTPKKIFEICFHSISSNSKLSFILLPSIVLMCMKLATDHQQQRELCRHLSAMVDKFLRNGQYFSVELGPMVVQLLSHLYDYLVEWKQARYAVHQLIVGTVFIRNRANRFDHEYSGVSMLIDCIPLPKMARLSYQAKFYHKSLQYLEHRYNELISSNVSPIVRHEFLQENLNFFYQIYLALDQPDSIKGLNRIAMRKQKLKNDGIDENLVPLLHNAMADSEMVGQRLICGARLNGATRKKMQFPVLDDAAPEEENAAYLVDCFNRTDYQDKYLQTMLSLDQDLSRFTPMEGSFSSNVHQWTNLHRFQIESAWKLGAWDELDNLVSHSNGNLDKQRSSASLVSSFNESPVHPYPLPTVGYILASFYCEDSPFVLENKINEIRSSFLPSLNAALLSNLGTAYCRSYRYSIVPIHIMHDIQQFASTVYNRLLNEHSSSINDPNHGPTNGSVQSPSASQIQLVFDDLLHQWRIRNQLLPIESSEREHVLEVQRALILLLQHHYQSKFGTSLVLSGQLFRYWSDSIRGALASGNLDRAFISLLEANRIRSSDSVNLRLSYEEQTNFVIDSAKIYWNRKDRHAALKLLKSEMETKYSSIRQHCYLETLKNLSGNLTEPELLEIANSNSLKFTRSHLVQLSGKFSVTSLIASTSTPIGTTGIGIGTSSTSSTGNATGNMGHLFGGPGGAGFVAQKRLTKMEQDIETMNDLEQMNYFARVQLQYARYCEEAKLLSSNSLIVAYKAALVADGQWEEGHFQLAMFYRRLYKEYQSIGTNIGSRTSFQIGKVDEVLELKAHTIRSLAESLKFGYQYAPISLPILVATWAELGYEYLSLEKRYRLNESNRSVAILKDLLRKYIERSTMAIRQLSTDSNNAIFFICLDLLITHMLHQADSIQRCIQDILVKLLADFPHHMSWQFSRSLLSNGRRGMASKDYLAQATKLSPQISKHFEFFRQFATNINELARYKPPKTNTKNDPKTAITVLSLAKIFPKLVRSVAPHPNVRFVLPCRTFFNPSLANLERFQSDQLFDQFFNNLFVERIEDSVQVMKSLQMPKKMNFICADGVRRIILCKCSDDLRKDRCMLNYCDLFNQCYRGELPNLQPMSSIEPQFDTLFESKTLATRRHNPLSVQSYYVSPLSDSFGVIEWIPGLVSLKSLVESQYARNSGAKEQFDKSKTTFIKSVFSSTVTREKRIERFINSLSAFQPPVFQNWFSTYYADSYSWFMARRNFARTSAVYSMLGYVLGLGDRHADNIQLDTRTGEVVHVDFNCLFNRGEEFLVPECVPFRLTHNLVSAMGVLGYEGTFRQTCEDVMLVLRQYRELFAQQVQIFLNDILVEWIESSDRNEVAERSVINVEARLYGIISRSGRRLPKGKSVSIAGQVDAVIKESIDISNLGAMYHGWAAFI